MGCSLLLPRVGFMNIVFLLGCWFSSRGLANFSPSASSSHCVLAVTLRSDLTAHLQRPARFSFRIGPPGISAVARLGLDGASCFCTLVLASFMPSDSHYAVSDRPKLGSATFPPTDWSSPGLPSISLVQVNARNMPKASNWDHVPTTWLGTSILADTLTHDVFARLVGTLSSSSF